MMPIPKSGNAELQSAVATAAPVGQETQPGEAENHHRPGRGLRNSRNGLHVYRDTVRGQVYLLSVSRKERAAIDGGSVSSRRVRKRGVREEVEWETRGASASIDFQFQAVDEWEIIVKN